MAEDEHAAGGGEDAGVPAKLSMEAFTEDWNESQFWVCSSCARRCARSFGCEMRERNGGGVLWLSYSTRDVFVVEKLAKGMYTNSTRTKQPRF